jgi:hypothetical protein
MRLAPLLLCLLLAACSCTHKLDDHKDRLFVDMYEPTVLVSSGEGGYGSGTVIWSEDGETYILTAAHVVKRHIFYPAGSPLSVTDWISHDAHTYPAQVIAYDSDKDLALLKAEYEAQHVADFADRAPELFEECRASGIGGPKIPLPVKGEMQGKSPDGMYFTSAPVYWGYSGGGLYIWDGGRWRVVGVIVQIGVIKHQIMPTLSIHVGLPTILEWLDELGYCEVL